MPVRTRAAAPAAQSVTTTFTMPPPVAAENPAPDESKPDFREYIYSLSPEQWRNHVIYLTRELPKTSINGLGGYLTKLQQPFDLEDIKNAYGGYEFSYILKEGNDICKKCRNASGRFKIEAPPKFDATREAAANPAPANGHSDGTGKLLQDFVGVLRDELARSRENGNGNSTATEEAIKLLSSASDRAMELMAKQIPAAGDPASQLTSLLAAAEKIAAMRAPAPAAGGLGELGTLLIPLLKGVVEKLLTPTDPLEQLSKLAGVLDVLEKIRGGSGGAGKVDWKAELVSEGVPAVKELVTAIVENRKSQLELAKEARARAEANARAAQSVEQITAQRAAAGVPANAPRPAAPAAAAPPPPAVHSAPGAGPIRLTPVDAAAPVESPGVGTPPNAANADEYTKGVKIRFVELLAEGEEVEMIVDWLDLSLPKFVKQMRNYPEAVVNQYMAQDPILAPITQQPGWPAWLQAAREYLGSEEEEAEPVAAGAGAAKPN